MTALDGAPDLDVLSKRFTKFGQGKKQLKILVLNKTLDLSKPSSGIQNRHMKLEMKLENILVLWLWKEEQGNDFS